MNAKLIGRDTQQFVRAFQEIHRILLELSKARWDEAFPVVLERAAKNSSVVAALASKLSDMHSLRQRTLNVWQGEPSATPSSAAVAELERILESLRPARRLATAGKPKMDGPHAQRETPNQSPKAVSGIAAAIHVLATRNNKEITVAQLTAEAMKAGWSPKGKSPKRTLIAALHNEIRRRGDRARFAKGRQPGMWKLSKAGVHYANEQVCMALHATEPDFHKSMTLLMKAHDYSVADEDGASGSVDGPGGGNCPCPQ